MKEATWGKQMKTQQASVYFHLYRGSSTKGQLITALIARAEQCTGLWLKARGTEAISGLHQTRRNLVVHLHSQESQSH